MIDNFAWLEIFADFRASLPVRGCGRVGDAADAAGNFIRQIKFLIFFILIDHFLILPLSFRNDVKAEQESYNPHDLLLCTFHAHCLTT